MSNSIADRKSRIDALRQMTPAQRLQMAFDLTNETNRRMKDTIRRRNPAASDLTLHQIYLDARARCRNSKFESRFLWKSHGPT